MYMEQVFKLKHELSWVPTSQLLIFQHEVVKHIYIFILFLFFFLPTFKILPFSQSLHILHSLARDNNIINICMSVCLCFAVPERGQWVSGVPTETTYVLTVLSTRGEGTSRDEANRSTWSMEMESPTSHPGTAGEPHSGPLPSFPAWSGGGHVSSDYAGYTEPKVTLSSRVSTYFSASGEPSSESF